MEPFGPRIKVPLHIVVYHMIYMMPKIIQHGTWVRIYVVPCADVLSVPYCAITCRSDTVQYCGVQHGA